jgi:hypothetical protein
MYRESAAVVRPRSELVVTLSPQDRQSSATALFQLFTAPLMVAVLLSVILSPTVGLLGLVATGAFVVWMWRRRGQAGRIVMAVESGDLIVQAGRRPLARMRLEDLEDVALDLKAIRPVQEGSSAIPAVRFLESKVGPEIDVARIVLVGGGSSVRLHESHVAHMTATEWLGKIRVFLRKNGWVPLDETDPKSAG